MSALRRVAALAAREIAERRMVLGAALAAGLIPLIVPLFASWGPVPAGDARDVAAALVALGFVLGTPLLVGGSLFGRDLAERRMGFYFSRPISGGGLWAGKNLGAAAVVGAATALVLLPAALVGDRFERLLHRLAIAPLDRSVLLTLAVAAAFLLSLGIAGGVATRSRSAWLLLDLLLAVFVALVAAAEGRRLADLGAIASPSGFAIGVIGTAAVVLLLASLAGVSLGRVDVRRVHGMQSVVLWATLLLGCALLVGYARWLVAAIPADLTGATFVEAGPEGPWLAVSGPVRRRDGYRARFLIDSATGRFFRLPGPPWAEVAFSADGRHAAWLEGPPLASPLDRASLEAPFEVWTLRLDQSGAKPHRTGLTLLDSAPLVLSPDGRRLATIGPKDLSIHSLSDGRLLFSCVLPGISRKGRVAKAWFLADGRLRVDRIVADSADPLRAGVEIFEADVDSRAMKQTGAVAVPPGAFPAIVSSRSGDRFLVFGRSLGVRAYDGRSGDESVEVPAAQPGAVRTATVLRDGRIVLGEISLSGSRLRVFSSRGAPERVIDLGPWRSLIPGGEVEPGRLAVALAPERNDPIEKQRLALVDLLHGLVEEMGPGLLPAMPYPGWIGVDPSSLPEPGSFGARLFLGPGGSLVELNPETGARKTILADRR
jgi:hypothetical protein